MALGPIGAEVSAIDNRQLQRPRPSSRQGRLALSVTPRPSSRVFLLHGAQLAGPTTIAGGRTDGTGQLAAGRGRPFA
eukprot:4047195-Lingulodinium_polyedra.AAC.1